MGKTKEYFYEQECRDICDAIQDIDFGDQDFQPTMQEMVTSVQEKIGYPIFHTYDEIEDMIEKEFGKVTDGSTSSYNPSFIVPINLIIYAESTRGDSEDYTIKEIEFMKK